MVLGLTDFTVVCPGGSFVMQVHGSALMCCGLSSANLVVEGLGFCVRVCKGFPFNTKKNSSVGAK